MVSLIQKLLQFLFIGLLIFVAVKPELIPPPAQSYAYIYSRAIFGQTVSYQSFKDTWSGRWNFVVHWLPQLKNLKAPWPEPPDPITGDWIMSVLNAIVIEAPKQKWQQVKQEMLDEPLTPVATESAAPADQQQP